MRSGLGDVLAEVLGGEGRAAADKLGQRTGEHDLTMTQREGEVEDVAARIFFLASPAARHITAQVLHVNGGALITR